MTANDEVRAPDLLGEIEAYRAWRVKGTRELPLLASATHSGTIWYPQRWTFAECSRSSAKDKRTCPNSKNDNAGPGVPGESCSCGLYAGRDLDHLVDLGYGHYYDDAHPTFIGAVGLAGKVIPGSQGWRAEKGRIIRLYVPIHLKEWITPLQRFYGVEVLLRNTFVKEEEHNIEDLAARIRGERR